MALRFGSKLDRTVLPRDASHHDVSPCSASFPGEEEEPAGSCISSKEDLPEDARTSPARAAHACVTSAAECVSKKESCNDVVRDGSSSSTRSRGSASGEHRASRGEAPKQKSVTSDAEIRLAQIIEEDSGRDCNADYPVPKWLRKQGVCSPFSYFRSFKASLGIINYDLRGPPGSPLVVTFHGLNGTQLTFFDLQEVLARFGYRTLIFDLYGHGLSASPRYSFFLKRYGLQFFVKQTDELLEHLGLENERISVVGFSMGCVIAAEYALHRQEFVDHICLVAPAGMLPNKPFPVRVLQRCGWCVSPCCCLVPTCVCRCCFSKKGFIQKYEEEENEERRRSSVCAACDSVAEDPGKEEKKRFLRRGKRKPEGGHKEMSATQECRDKAKSSSLPRQTATRQASQERRRRRAETVSESNSAQRGEEKTSSQYGGALGGVSPGELLWRRLMWQLYVKKGVVATFVGCVTHVPLWDGRKIYERLGETGKPVLLLWGEEDTVAPLSCSAALRMLIPNSHLIAFPSCSHLVLADRAQASIGCIMALLDFPRTCDLRRWQFALPFDAGGAYVPPHHRAPPGVCPEDYLRELRYSPKFTIRLSSSDKPQRLPRRAQSRASTETRPKPKGDTAGATLGVTETAGEGLEESASRELEETGGVGIREKVRAQMREEMAAATRREGELVGKRGGDPGAERQERRMERQEEVVGDSEGERVEFGGGEKKAEEVEEDAFGETGLRPAEDVEGELGGEEEEELFSLESLDETEGRAGEEKASETVHLRADGRRPRSASMAAAAAATSHLLSFDSNSTQEILLQGNADHVLVPALSAAPVQSTFQPPHLRESSSSSLQLTRDS
ncbi:hydrolase, alpha/beta fold family protein [Toxoplasma gondii GAB2-2007-GAL-DOM2]|uniref:Hydrolase, alpha/beta fold family domain containing protein n=2 Tax=Toxoplasma gondii TaxID=5811 RepID=B9QAV2_TOXGV|nr:hydrolase, alpha/beta fold family protein [Toxoplasma gondii VEG]KFG49426.1 hydrolase, alpha/beta fold family protein [Toxoplasma gondii GAB2-2007-GAL-DOM2]CEL74233.1 TPA: hydrolase, alpha/beta fold family domain containing protein [Toxoplasma gondii VEG]